jgi:hypothetical protein
MASATTSPGTLIHGRHSLGSLLPERGDRVGAEAAYRSAIATDHHDLAPSTAFNLTRLLDERRDGEGEYGEGAQPLPASSGARPSYRPGRSTCYPG